MAYDFEDNSGPQSRDNAGGLALHLLYAPVSWFSTIEVPGTYTNPGDEVKITANHAFSTGKGFVKLRAVPDSHGLSVAFNEARDSSGYMATIEADVVGTSEEITAEVLRNLMTEDVIVLAETANGKYIQLGTEGFPAQLRQIEDTTGTSADGQNKQRVRVVANQPKKFFYSGTITLKP